MAHLLLLLLYNRKENQMRLKMGLLAAATLAIAAAGTANADVYSVSQSLSGDGYNRINFSSTPFDTSLGTLTGASFTVVGSENVLIDYQLERGEPLPPAQVGLHNTITLSGYGGNNPYNYSYDLPDSVAATTSDTIQGTVDVNQTFVLPANEFFNFIPPGSQGANGDVGLFSTDYDFTTGRPAVVAESEGNYFHGALIETFTYTPTDVPEPGSLALLGTALVMVGGAMRLRRRGRAD